jgi:GNAT superfamily N-acetyltransferase
VEIRLLQASDDRSAFRSGDSDLDRFFQRYAGQNQFRHHLGSTYVAVDQERILGYATVAPGQLEIDDLPAALRKKLPAYPLPILRLARLAVDEAVRGQGLGKEILRFVLQLAVRLASDYGCTGVLVDAKAEAIAFYGKLGFVALEVVEGQSDARPALTPMLLSVREIQAAARRSS